MKKALLCAALLGSGLMSSALWCPPVVAQQREKLKSYQPALSGILNRAAEKIGTAQTDDAGYARLALVRQMALNSDYDAAKKQILFIKNPSTLAVAWAALGKMQGLLDNDKAAAKRSFEEAAKVAGTITNEYDKNRELASIASRWWESGDPWTATEFAKSLSGEARTKALESLVQKGAWEGEIAPFSDYISAKKTKDQDEDFEGKLEMLEATRNGDSPKLRARIRKIADARRRVVPLLAAYDHPAKGKNADPQLLDEAVQILTTKTAQNKSVATRVSKKEQPKADELTDEELIELLAGDLAAEEEAAKKRKEEAAKPKPPANTNAEDDDLLDALSSLPAIEPLDLKTPANEQALAAIAWRQLRANSNREYSAPIALTTLKKISDMTNASPYCVKMADDLASHDQLARALEIADLTTGSTRADILCGAVRGLGQAMKSAAPDKKAALRKSVVRVGQQAIDVCFALPSNSDQGWGLANIVGALAATGDYEGANQGAKAIETPRRQAYGYAGIALAAIENGDEKIARESLKKMEETAHQEKTNTEIAQVIAQSCGAILEPLAIGEADEELLIDIW